MTEQGVQRRVVENGSSDGLNIEVKGGLNEGDEVIIAKMASSEISDKAASTKGPRRF